MSRLRRMLVQLGLLASENQLRRIVRSSRNNFLNEREEVGALKSMPLTRERSLKGRIAGSDCHVWLFDRDRRLWISFPSQAQQRIRMRPSREPLAERTRQIRERLLALRQNRIVSFGGVGFQRLDRVIELDLRTRTRAAMRASFSRFVASPPSMGSGGAVPSPSCRQTPPTRTVEGPSPGGGGGGGGSLPPAAGGGHDDGAKSPATGGGGGGGAKSPSATRIRLPAPSVPRKRNFARSKHSSSG